jgi:hypothetical protein
MSDLVSVQPEIERDRYGRPMILPPGGSKKVAYTRCTTYVDALEDKYNLQKWQQRMVILGLVDRPDLLLSAAAHRDDKQKLNRIADDAVEAAKAHAAATVGTAVHALCERIDAGQEVGPVPGEYQRDLDAYVRVTAPLTVLHSETFTVLDDLRIGGTPDRIVEFEGERYIADIKTGSIEWGSGKIAMQLAVYAHSRFYNMKTGERSPLPGVNGDRGIVIHLPAGTGQCTLHWTNIAAGWEAVQLATKVRDWRARKDLQAPITAATPAADVSLGTDPIVAAIENAATPEDLVAVWASNEANWRLEYTQIASRRKAQLAQTA